MNFILDNWYLIVLVLASGAMLLLPAIKGAGGGLSAAQAVQLINREKALVIDVCEPAEFAAGHVGGAKNIPLAQLQERLPQVAKNKAGGSSAAPAPVAQAATAPAPAAPSKADKEILDIADSAPTAAPSGAAPVEVHAVPNFAGMPLRKFLLVSGVTSLITSAGYLFIGYLIGEPAVAFMETYAKYMWYLSIGIIAVMIGVAFLRLRRRSAA